MTIVRDERGFTMIELLVATTLSLIVLAAALNGLSVFTSASGSENRRNDDQASARIAIDRLTFDLRNVAAPGATAAGALEQAGAYSTVFQTVDSSQVAGGSNLTNVKRVRYCLDTSTPSSETLWKQVQTWTTASAPAIPSTASCPGVAWPNQTMLVQHITNQNNGHQRPLFTYGPGASPTAAQITSVQMDIFLAGVPGQLPPESELTGGAALRNGNEPPVASFTATPANGHLLLNASTSTDPNGQALTYQWSLDGTAIAGATSQQYDLAGLASHSTHTIALSVSDPGGLVGSNSKLVVMP